MGIRYQHGRRRRILVAAANLPSSSVATSSVRGRIVVAPIHPRRLPPPVSLVRVASTKIVSGVDGPPPPTGGGGSPKPLQPTMLCVNAAHRAKPLSTPIVTHTKYTQPPKDGLPNQVVIVPPARRPPAPVAAIVHTTCRWGLNQGKLPNPPAVVPRHVRRRRLKGIMTILPGGQEEEQPPTFRTIVLHGRAPLRVQTPVVLHSPYDVEKQNRPFGTGPVVVVNHKVRRRLKGIMTILPADAYELVPPLAAAPHVVPFHRNLAKDFRLPLILTPKPSIRYRTTPVFTPIVVPRHIGSRPAPWVFTSQFLKFIPPPPRHDPLPHTLVARVVRRHPSLWPRPVVTTSILQPDDQRYTKPWDLIAACIAWLRTKPTIVSEFGDVKDSETHQKFVSDVELPRTDPPYVVFSEPQEFEGYESRGSSGLMGSIVHGAFVIEVVGTEKLKTRQMADDVAASLQDAPLVFFDGILLYLRRTERQFPSFRATGNGRNVTLYKRIVEFEYFIERYF